MSDMTANEEIKETLLAAKSLRDIPAVANKLREYPDEVLFNNLFFTSVEKQEKGKPVAFAAYVLNELNPKCSLTCEQAIKSLLSSWEISIEEVVYYLAKQFGKEHILNAISSLSKTHTQEDELMRLRVIKHWLGTASN
jgi:hypothetical protein